MPYMPYMIQKNNHTRHIRNTRNTRKQLSGKTLNLYYGLQTCCDKI